jgi:SSS family solute:Na+ symporter
VRQKLVIKVMDDIVKEDRFSDFRQDATHFLSTGEINATMQARMDKATADEQVEAARIEELKEEQYALDPASRPATVQADSEQEPQRLDREAAFHTVHKALKAEEDDGKKKAATLQAIYRQMRVPVALKHIFPVGITGAFCAIMIFMLISTDTSYIHSWGSIIVQDLILPFRKKPFTPKQQLNLLRFVIAGVAVFAFFFSFLYKQNDYILMFFAITGAIWLGGSGPCILFGLYWKRGTTAAAFAALISGSFLSVGSILARANWVDKIYPWLLDTGHITWVRNFLEGVSRPFNPIIVWKVTGDMYPINSREAWFIIMLISFGLYVGISLLSRRKPFNVERMLHRGKYHVEGKAIEKPKWTLLKIIGIDAQYTKGDKVLAWSVFLWSVLYSFGTCLVIVIWNTIYSWPEEWWRHWFFINYIVIYAIIAIVSTLWFTIGTTWDLRRMFRRLAAKDVNVRDDGRVIGHISTGDVELVEKIEHRHITEDSEDQEDRQ